MSEATRAQVLGPGMAATGQLARVRLGTLTNIQVLRGLAASFVALLHAALQVESLHGDGRFVKIFTLHLGALGVALFFAVSGFLMAQLVRTAAPGTFLIHRVTRIYPIFLIVAGTFMVAAPLLGIDSTRDWLALTLVPVGKRSYVLGIEWTLLYETTFYVALFLISASGLVRWLNGIAIGWLVVLSAVALSGSEATWATLFPRIQTILLSDVNVAFAAGLLLPAAIARGLLPARLCLAAAPVGLALVWAEVTQVRWALSAAAVVMVAGAVQIRQISANGLAGKTLVRFGDWSYALYLVHMPAIFAVHTLAPASASTSALFLSTVVAAFAGAALFGSLDVALYRRIRRRVDAGPASRLVLPAWGFAILYVGTAAFVSVRLASQDAEDRRASTAIARLPPGALSDPERLDRAISDAGLRAQETFVGALEKAIRLRNGQILAIGWAAELDRPAAIPHLALVCDGKVAALARPQRFRADVVRQLGRSEFGRLRIGFTAASEPGECPTAASVAAIFVDSAGGLLAGRPVPVDAPGRP